MVYLHLLDTLRCWDFLWAPSSRLVIARCFCAHSNAKHLQSTPHIMFYTVHPNSLTVHKIGKKEPLHSPIMSHPPPERSWSERIPWRTTAQRPGLAHSWWAASTPAPGHGGHGCHGSPPSSCHWELPRAAAGPRSGQRPQGRSRGGREDIATPWRGRSGLVFLFWRTIWLWCFLKTQWALQSLDCLPVV